LVTSLPEQVKHFYNQQLSCGNYDFFNSYLWRIGMFSDKEIEKVKDGFEYFWADGYHQHNDCIRIAAHWLDAQKRTKVCGVSPSVVKHTAEIWAQRYVSASDVEVAAHLLGIGRSERGLIGVSKLQTRPAERRLRNISEAGKHNYTGSNAYTYDETTTG
jgi:hypothetical protein